jgi:hypothetical protein
MIVKNCELPRFARIVLTLIAAGVLPLAVRPAASAEKPEDSTTSGNRT